MTVLYAFVASGLFGCGLYMVLSRHLVRLLLGLSLLTTAVNLMLFQAGRIQSVQPPLIPDIAAIVLLSMFPCGWNFSLIHGSE